MKDRARAVRGNAADDLLHEEPSELDFERREGIGQQGRRLLGKQAEGAYHLFSLSPQNPLRPH